MPTSYAVERTIGARPETVWSLLADSSTYAARNRAVVSIEGAIGKGATVRLVSIVNPKRTFTLAVTELDAPSRMVGPAAEERERSG